MFFNKKKPKESNEIMNKELKERIADTALSILQEGIDFEDLAYTKVEFGYLFDIDGHGIESLFKIITDKTTLSCILKQCLTMSDNALVSYIKIFHYYHWWNSVVKKIFK